MNQEDLQVDLYQGLVDAMKNDTKGIVDLQNSSPRVILLSNFISSARKVFEFF
jgi:hypothetical protein